MTFFLSFMNKIGKYLQQTTRETCIRYFLIIEDFEEIRIIKPTTNPDT